MHPLQRCLARSNSSTLTVAVYSLSSRGLENYSPRPKLSSCQPLRKLSLGLSNAHTEAVLWVLVLWWIFWCCFHAVCECAFTCLCTLVLFLQQAAISVKCNDLPTPGGCARRISVASVSFRPSWSHTGWVWRSLSNMLSLLDRLSYPESRGQPFTSFFSGETLSMFFTRLWRNKVIC